ncbi:XRE family transcriptional regulator [Rhizobium sp. BK602]|uniref:XRE family transcriptional regulator n=1 Tax=Rhizobium sp. BK602 TaxID=2586986 RepID=UPI0016084855|nr:XRE family transcriptional regulator [Rhizobium sp. BK602]MBB3608638.1 transcriptional regulator with XRE-family HTH domain [Rhizobium sp. BK602]
MAAKDTIPPNNIEAIRRAKKWSMEKLGEEIGTDASTVSKIEKSKIRPATERLLKIAAALEVSVDDLFASHYVPPPPAPTSPPSGEGSQIQVMGAAAGSLASGTMQITEGPIDWIDRPKALENARGIYGLYIDGTSMEPLHRHGSLVLVSEYKPARIGDAVVIQEQRMESEPMMASIGILYARTGEKVVLQKLNPAGSFVEINAKFVKTIHKVLDYGELLGLA